MGRVEKTVFISYRRTNIPWALAIYQNLTAHGYDVFFDYDSIASGDFEQVILGNIRARAHFLVVLTPSALERCVSPDDWLRREIETALNEKRNIVPLFLEGFDFGSPSISKYLTGKLETLKKYNGQNVPAGFFEEAMGKIRDKFLNVPLDSVLHPVSATVQKEVEKQQVSANEATQVKEKELTAQEWFEKGYKSTDANEKIHHYTEAIRLKQDYANAYYYRGNVFKSQGDLENAIQDYTRSIKLKKPRLHLAYRRRGIARANKGDLDGAIEDYTEAYYDRGLDRRAKGDLDGAIQDYTYSIELKNPNLHLPYTSRGIAHAAKGDLDSAIKDYTKAIRIKPDYAEAYYHRGIDRKSKGDLDGAIKDYTEAIRLLPDFTDAYNNRGIAHKDKGDLDIAIKDYTEAISLMPDYVNAYYNRAYIWKKKKNFFVAIADYQKYLDLGGGVRNGDQEKVERYIRILKNKIK